MPSEQMKRLSLDALLVQVLEKPKPDRPEFIGELCRDDTALRREVEDMVQAHEEAGGFLEKPAVAITAKLGNGVVEGVGTVIDRYRLLQLIGEGGFGAVYVAEQKEPVKRRVALKIIKLGMDTRQVIARFEAERQALAMMEHPNIARVLDAGATETGRPYFVMELVKGVSITEYCDQNDLSTRGRLELFRDVCHAVQHAHQKGIVHRDIKPSNVLVTLHDGRPVPKVIDFGIAKAMNQELTEKTIFTEFHQFIGTPEYMSPEQAEISGLDIDARSDIYSLGVLLYELLTGTTPFENKTLRQAGYAEIQRVIREEDPPKPSQRVSTLGEELTSIAKHRQIDPSSLKSLMRGDLDWIAMKTLEKNRTRRYETADGLAADIQRHLDDEPVLASPPSTTYRMQKFVRRHRGVVVAGSTIAATLVIGFTLSIVGFAHARQQEHYTSLEATKARAVSGFLQGMLVSVDPNKAQGREISVRFMLDEAGAQIEAGVLKDQPDVEAEIRRTLGNTYFALGLHPPAQEQLEQALAISRDLYGNDDARVADLLQELGYAVVKNYAPLAAEPLLREALAIRRRTLGKDDPAIAETLSALGLSLHCSGRLEEAEPLYREALEIQRGPEGEDWAVAAALRSLAGILRERGDQVGAARLAREANFIKQDTPKDDPWAIAKQLRTHALSLKREGKYAIAEQRYLESLQMYRQHFGNVHPEVAYALPGLAWIYFEMGDFDRSAAIFRDAVAMNREIYGDTHMLVMGQMQNLIRVLRAKGAEDEARQLLRDVVADAPALLTGEHPMAETLECLAAVLLDGNDAALVEPLFQEALEVDRRVLGSEHPLLALSMTNLAGVLELAGKSAEAEALLHEALELRRRVQGDGHPATVELAGRVARRGGG